MHYLFIPIVTIMWVGYFPFLPGTVASFLGMILWWFIPNKIVIQLGLISSAILVSIFFLKHNRLESKDPSYVVIDELIGIWISLLMVPKQVEIFILSFLIFRFFDILKPSIIYHVQYMRYPYGIIMDDIVSGIFTIAIVATIVFL